MFTARTIPYARSGGDQIPNGLSRDPFTARLHPTDNHLGLMRVTGRGGDTTTQVGFRSGPLFIHRPEQPLDRWRDRLAGMNAFAQSLTLDSLDQLPHDSLKALGCRLSLTSEHLKASLRCGSDTRNGDEKCFALKTKGC